LKTNKSPILPLIPSPEDKDGMSRYMQSVNQFLQDLSLNARADLDTVDGSTTSLDARVTTAEGSITSLDTRIDALEASPYMHVRDEKANNTAGGTSVATTWTKRVLNTSVANTITGASLASDTITLPDGTYDFHASFPAYAGSYIRGKIRNTSDNSDIIVGPSAYYYSTYGSYLYSFSGRFVIAAEKNIQLQYWVSVGVASGLGLATNSGGVEVYASLEIWKIA